MFKKFKDKLAEEMKQSPARLQASMQQLAQAVVSPALSNSSIQELSASNDNFSLTEEGDETPKNSPARHGFQNVDLTSPASNSMGLSRRSSVSSITSVDAASLFPIYESPGNMYHLQSDMEQSASEVDENISTQLDRVSKDQLYAAYRKVQTKYHKYRGRYTDLANHYREMERVKGKLESLLVETQDKAMRRIADLKEQCQLEQQAKAHLEDALRNDIEEKDHVIDTLNTKVRLLQASRPVSSSPNTIGETSVNNPGELLVDISSEIKTSPSQSHQSEVSILAAENTQLKSKLEKLESLIAKYKESLKRNKEKMSEITQERSIIERDFDISRKSSAERFSQLEDDLNVARTEILNLRDQMTAMRKREEESVISLAENKLSIHRELEVKEEQIKELRKELAAAKQARETLEESVERYKSELQSLRTSGDDSTDAEKADLVRDLSKGKTEALKLMQAEMQRRVIELEETMGLRCHEEEAKNRELTEKLERREEDLRCFEREIVELRGETEAYREKCEALREELSRIKDKEYRNEIGNRSIDAKRNEVEHNCEIESKQNDTEKLPPSQQKDHNEAESKKNEVGHRCKEVEEKLREAENKYADVQQKLTEAELKLKETEKLCEELNQRWKEEEEKYSELKQKKSETEKTNNEAELKLREAEKLCAEVEQRRHDAEKKLKDTENLHNEIAGKLDEAQKKYSEVEEKLNEAGVSLSNVEQRRNETEAKYKEIEQLLSDVEKSYNQAQQRRLEEESKYKEVEEKIQEMEKLYNEVELRRNEAEKSFAEGELRRREAISMRAVVDSTQNKSTNQSNELEAAKEEQTLQQKGTEDSREAEYTEKGENSYKIECQKLRVELSPLKVRCEELKCDGLKTEQSEKEIVNSKVEEPSGIAEKDEIIRQLSAKVQLYNAAILKARERLEAQQTELHDLRNSAGQDIELSKLREETEEKSVEILGIASELKSGKSMINDLKERIREDGEKIDLLTKEKICLIANVLGYKKTIVELRQTCTDIRTKIEDSAKVRNEEFERVEKMFKERLSDISNFETAKGEEIIERLEKAKDELERELKERNNEILVMREKVERWDETNRKNNKLIAEIDSLNFRIYDLEKLKLDLQQTSENLESLKLETVELRKNGEESAKLRAEGENREKNLQELESANDELRNNNENLEDINSKIKSEYENERKAIEDKNIALQSELDKLKVEYDNRQQAIDDYTKKLAFFQTECSERDEGLEALRVEMEIREKLLEDTIAKSKNWESELSKLSEEKSSLETELESREKTLIDAIEKTKYFEDQLSKLTEEKSKIDLELESLKSSSTELAGANETLTETINSKNVLLKKLKLLKERQSQTIQDNTSKISELETKLSEFEAKNQELEVEKSRNAELAAKISEFETLLESMRGQKEESELTSTNVTKERDDLNKIGENLRLENSSILQDLEKMRSQNKEFKERCNELETKLSEFEATNQQFTLEKSKNAELVAKISEFEAVLESLRGVNEGLKLESMELKKERDDFNQTHENLRTENSSLLQDLEKLQFQNKESKELCNELEKSSDDSKRLEEEMKKKLNELEKKTAEQARQISTLNDEIARRDEELKVLGENSGKRLEDFEELRERLEQDFNNRVDSMEDEYMAKYRDRELEAKKIEDALRSKLAVKELELQTKIQAGSQDDNLKELVKELQRRLQENESKLSSSEAKESQIQSLNEELKMRADSLKTELETHEAEQSMRLKQLVKEFQAQLHDKDEELQAALDKRFESQQTYESDLVQQYREQLKDFQVELTAKSEEIERLIIENKEQIATKNTEVEKLIETIEKIKQEHVNELREVERKWKITLKQKSDQLEMKHDEEVNELTQEWQNERRNDEKTDDSPRELESTSRVAMAAVQSNTGSLHSLQQTMVSQRRELAELRKLVKLRQDTLEDSTEIEYLRNILYEYMMGRETVVLARVIAAVVKFDQEQTTKILKKEEDKLTLLGSLGLT